MLHGSRLEEASFSTESSRSRFSRRLSHTPKGRTQLYEALATPLASLRVASWRMSTSTPSTGRRMYLTTEPRMKQFFTDSCRKNHRSSNRSSSESVITAQPQERVHSLRGSTLLWGNHVRGTHCCCQKHIWLQNVARVPLPAPVPKASKEKQCIIHVTKNAGSGSIHRASVRPSSLCPRLTAAPGFPTRLRVFLRRQYAGEMA